MAKLKDDEILSIVKDRMDSSESMAQDSFWLQERDKALDYYYRRPFGNEQPERSQFITSDVHDIVESSMPGMMEIFASSDDAVLFEASPADPAQFQIAEQQAKEANAAVQRVLWHENPGFLVLHNWIKDAHQQKFGVVTWYVEEIDEVQEQTLQGLSLEHIAQLQQTKDAEIVAHSANVVMQPGVDPMTGAQMMQPVEMHDITVRKTVKRRRVTINNVPPHEFVPDHAARSMRPADMDFCAHVKECTLSELRMLGLIKADEDLEDEGAPGYIALSSNAYRQDDTTPIDSGNHGTNRDEAMKTVWLRNCYIKLDADGDGIAELRNIKYAGNRILDNSVVDHIPFAVYTPTPLPNQFHGLSLADEGMDIQELKSTLLRQTLDAIYMANEPRIKVRKGAGVELDDILTVRPNGLIRMNDTTAVEPMIVPAQALNQAMPLIEYADTIREVRTGITRYNQGLDGDSLNKTARGVNLIFNASQQRERLRARVLAEVGMKDLYWGIVRTLKAHEFEGLYAKVDGQVVHIDPSKWNMKYDISINVGIGSGNKDQMLMHLQAVAQDQIAAIQMGGLGKIVTLKNIYNTLTKKVENMGYKSANDFWTDPDSVQEQPPQPNPDIEKEKMRSDTELKKAKMQGDVEMAKKQMELQAKAMQDAQRMRNEAIANGMIIQ